MTATLQQQSVDVELVSEDIQHWRDVHRLVVRHDVRHAIRSKPGQMAVGHIMPE